MNGKVHIVLASDVHYLPGLEVTRASIVRSCSAPERLVWHVFDERGLDAKPVVDMPKWNGSHMPYLRLWLPVLLPEVDWVVYSDVDTLWNRDVCELWDLTVQTEAVRGSAICWVRDLASMRYDAADWIEKVVSGEGLSFDWSRYACSGVCVLNLKKMRELDFTRRVLDLYARYGVPRFPDQDVLNVLLNHDSVLLQPVWNTMGDCSNLPPEGAKCVYHLTGVGRHFRDAAPPIYPPQYQLWWNVAHGERGVQLRSRLLACVWPLRGLCRLLPLRLRERVFRQWFFARVLTTRDNMVN